MKMKWVWIVLALVILLGLGAYGYHKLSGKMMKPAMTVKNGGVLDTIQNALAGKLSLECHFTSDANMATIAYIKMGAVHVDSNVGTPQAASFLMKDKKMYFWQINSKQGTMMNVPEVSMTPSATGTRGAPTGSASDMSKGFMTTLEKFKDSCKPTVVADSLFVVPTNVTFTDVSQMMKAIPSGMMPSGIPTGMMQNYQVPTGSSGY